MSSRLRRSTRFALTPAERALIDDNKHTSTGKKDNKREILKRGGSADSKSSKKGKPEKEKEKDKEKEKVEKMREKKNPKRNSESALPDGSGAGTAEPPKKTRKSADSSLSPVTQNRKREGQTTSAPSIEPQPPAENSVTLPSIYDEAAIDAFFKKNKKRTFRDLLGESLERDQDSHLIAGAQQLLKDPSSASTSDAIKQIIGAGSREMSVKEALALNFRNYRVRMPKQRYDALVSGNIISAAMFEPNYGRDDPSLISPSGVHTPQQRMNLQEMITVMQEMGANPANPLNLDANEEGNETSFNLEEFLKSVPFPGKSSKTIAELLIEMNFREDTFEQSSAAPVTVQEQTPSYLVSNGHKGYPFFPFWKLPTNVSRGYRNVYYVQGIKYVLLNTIMYQDAIIVPMNEPISFRFNDYLFDMSLNDLLIANGILIHDHTSCRDMLAFLNSCGFAIHHDLSEYLMGTYGPNISGNAANSKKDLLPISLTPEFPPFVAHKLDYFVLGFGRRYGINEIVDVTQTLSRAPLSHFSSAPAARVQPPRNPVSAPVQASDSSVPETSIDNEEEGVKNLRRNTVICAALSSGQKADIVAERFGITSDEVIEIGKTREEVARQFTEHYTSLLAERDSSMRAHDLNCSDLVMSHKKRTGKVGIRRTNYVGLNVMMWRFFKDCKDNGICLNGKLLKEQAMLYAKQLGLENFKGSEGWLDAFKRRHKIDLKAMSGVPVNYEDDVSTKMEYDEENEGILQFA
ncbi:hypothetical protein WR25_02565 isoform C [Diploscapter pachys]|uniref:HTH CENPB-type domain-containing protein n=1 Tax=Diploscapter pachys TaxID=2018661 RepID=A0A2A2L9U3_9BILA|nr:hypothetical protein WR25_02565 isoform A [Diploscapter pachys]PAV83028.1 hypothetical protein WR25_02565 isoform C [Diploscapter pachys]